MASIRLRACALALLSACAGTPPPTTRTTVAVDLLEAFPATRGGGATAEITASDPGARRHLVGPWTVAPTLDGEPVLWPSGARARLWFEAERPPVDTTLMLDVVLDPATPRPLDVIVRLNRTAIGRLQLADGARAERIRVSAAAQTPGRNTLELFLVGRQLSGRPGRLLGVRAIRFERGGAAAPAPLVRDEDLVLPPGTSVDYFLRLPAAANLVWHDGGGGAPLLTVETDGGPARRLLASADGAALRADLGRESGALARLTLAAAEGGAVVRRPRLVGWSTGAPRSPPPARETAARPNVVLYLVDTLRADRLGCYGYRPPTSPNVDAFAREAVLFERVIAQSSWTRPAAASILTGRYPDDHRAMSLMDAMRPDAATLADLLGAAGYATAAFVTNLNVGAQFGFGRGFGTFHYLEERDERSTVYASATELNAAAFPWIEAHRRTPFFVYLHASDPHAPYRPGAEAAARFVPAGIHPTVDPRAPVRRLMERRAPVSADDVAFLSGLYDAEVAGVDAGFGGLLAELRALGLDRSTLVVFVADHGEEFHAALIRRSAHRGHHRRRPRGRETTPHARLRRRRRLKAAARP